VPAACAAAPDAERRVLRPLDHGREVCIVEHPQGVVDAEAAAMVSGTTPSRGRGRAARRAMGSATRAPSAGVMRVPDCRLCISASVPSPPWWAPWPTGCGVPCAHVSPVSLRTPQTTAVRMQPPLHAGAACGLACAIAL
jgi:hypothetical protein